MKKIQTHIRDIFIALVTIIGGAYVYRLIMKTKGPLVRVVVFHDVTDKEWFASTVACLETHYHLLSPEAFFAHRFEATKINVLITFDDGYDSWATVCAPVLTEHQTHAIFFVNSGLLDVHGLGRGAQAHYLTDNLLLSRPRVILSWGDLALLKDQGHMIGGHTRSHVRLSEAPESKQVTEIGEDKKNIEQHLKVSLGVFAYPFGRRGDYTHTSSAVVKEAGYQHAFTTESGFVCMGSGEEHYRIPRMCIEDGLTPRELRRWIDGGYDLYAKIKNICVR